MQNYNAIVIYTSRKIYNQKRYNNKCWGDFAEIIAYTLLVQMQNATATIGKLKQLSHDPESVLLGLYSSEIKTYVYRSWRWHSVVKYA